MRSLSELSSQGAADMASHDHDHDHDHGPDTTVDEAAARAAADPMAVRIWRIVIASGALLLAVGWVLWPTLHSLQVERPFRYIAGSPFTFGFAAHMCMSTWLLTLRPPFVAYGGHGAGTSFLRALALIGVTLAGLETWMSDHPVAIGLIGWLEYPVVVVWLGLGFAYVGRLLRLEGDGRFANLADLTGVSLVLLWIASQLVSGYPSWAVLGPGAAAMAVGLLVLAVLARRYLLIPAPNATAPHDSGNPDA